MERCINLNSLASVSLVVPAYAVQQAGTLLAQIALPQRATPVCANTARPPPHTTSACLVNGKRVRAQTTSKWLSTCMPSSSSSSHTRLPARTHTHACAHLCLRALQYKCTVCNRTASRLHVATTATTATRKDGLPGVFGMIHLPRWCRRVRGAAGNPVGWSTFPRSSVAVALRCLAAVLVALRSFPVPRLCE